MLLCIFAFCILSFDFRMITCRFNIRERIEEREESLSPYATKSRYSRGRMKKEELCPIRTCFQRDRDRIIHSKALFVGKSEMAEQEDGKVEVEEDKPEEPAVR